MLVIFVVQVTPMINVDLTRPPEEALPSLSLEDVWRFYHDPSLHGREVRLATTAHPCN